MKKICILAISIFLAVICSSCAKLLGAVESMGAGLIETSQSSQETPPSTTRDYIITFRQLGQKDVYRLVKKGESLTELPQPRPRTGYTVVWEEVDLTNVQKNLLVTAVETPNVYTITYNANGGTLDSLTQEVTFDSQVVLAEPTLEGYDFVGWTCDGKAVTSGKWKIAEDITLEAQYVEIFTEKVTVTFNRTGEAPISVQVVKGQSLSAEDYPALAPKTGYIVAWDKTLEQLANLTENVTVTATETPKTYTLYLTTRGGVLDEEVMTVTYGEVYTLPVPVRANYGSTTYTFTTWTYKDEDIPLTGIWLFDDEICEVIAYWASGDYSGFH